MAETKLNIEQVLDLSTALEDKANSVHTHAIADVDGLEDALGQVGNYLPLSGGTLTGPLTMTSTALLDAAFLQTNQLEVAEIVHSSGTVNLTASLNVAGGVEATSLSVNGHPITIQSGQPASPSVGDLWIEV